MSWGAWILVGIYPATLALGLAYLNDAETGKLIKWKPLAWLRLGRLLTWARGLAKKHLRFLEGANLILGIGLGTYTGLLLGTLAARGA